ncbi:unnamed protein product [Closterium sp. Naga37s-1]|nr:unnamed protein product [Closterium sp. Naga37s-1]
MFPPSPSRAFSPSSPPLLPLLARPPFPRFLLTTPPPPSFSPHLLALHSSPPSPLISPLSPHFSPLPSSHCDLSDPPSPHMPLLRSPLVSPFSPARPYSSLPLPCCSALLPVHRIICAFLEQKMVKKVLELHKSKEKIASKVPA